MAYATEREGQLDFFEKYNINFENNYGEEILKDSTDGIYHGSILEFKLNINDLNKVLLQTIKYLSRERIKGHNVPAQIFLIDLNKNTVYEFKSKDYFDDIHKVYNGASSKENEGFINENPKFTLYLDKPEDQIVFLKHLQKTEFLPINIDENCIVGWAERYYRENPKATKDDLLSDDGELRKPNKFKGLINPYTAESNEKFKYLMDKLNDKIKKKKLGAFYTPIPYCEKAAELVRDAIKRVPEGNDYIILDRCAGTGNLESVLTDDELSHCVLNTYEYFEWLVLRERLEDKVRKILPDGDATFDNGFIKENDAMSEEFVNNEYIKKFIDDPKCTIIMLENPPYQESGGISGDSGVSNKKEYIWGKMSEIVKGVTVKDMANRFIWSAFKYYLMANSDSYVVFSPIKYWKASNFVNKKVIKGLVFNKKHFHAQPSAITCIEFTAEPSPDLVLKDFEIYDIASGSISYLGNIDCRRVKNVLSDTLYDRKKDTNDTFIDYNCTSDGNINYCKNGSKYNNDIIGFITLKSYINTFNNLFIGRLPYPGITGGTYIRKNNYLNVLPGACAKMYYLNNDTFYKDFIYSSADGGKLYEKDKTFLKSCLIYTSLIHINYCKTIKTDDKILYNELCFDTLSSHKSQALIDLATFKQNADDRSLIKLWNKIMIEASQTTNYNKDYSYGLYQIIKELNTFKKNEDGKNVYDYPALNGDINSLKVKLKTYYKKYIEPKCFKYELLK